jgi:hypothetical protein
VRLVGGLAEERPSHFGPGGNQAGEHIHPVCLKEEDLEKARNQYGQEAGRRERQSRHGGREEVLPAGHSRHVQKAAQTAAQSCFDCAREAGRKEEQSRPGHAKGEAQEEGRSPHDQEVGPEEQHSHRHGPEAVQREAQSRSGGAMEEAPVEEQNRLGHAMEAVLRGAHTLRHVCRAAAPKAAHSRLDPRVRRCAADTSRSCRRCA